MSNTNTTSKCAKSSRRRRNATTTTTDTGNTGGAAAEPEPEPEPPGSTSATSYNVRDYQNPDAGAEQALTTPTKTKKKGKKGSTSQHVCFHCGKAGAKCSCGQCHRAFYCGRDCQRADWKRHKRACRAAVAAEARRATRAREATAAARVGGSGGRPPDETQCVICIGPVRSPVELPCGHQYCGACLAELRSKGVSQTCPLCRAELPPGVEGLYELASRAVMRIQGMVQRGEASWASLPAAEREEIEEAIAMLTEAGAQGHAQANHTLGFLLENVRQDVDGAEAAYRAAIAADPGYANAHYNLGVLLKNERNDVDGAEAAYRAAIAADPGYALAHSNLGALFATSAEQSEQSGGDLGGTTALWDQAVEHFANAIAVGSDDRMLNMAKTDAARVRAALQNA